MAAASGQGSAGGGGEVGKAASGSGLPAAGRSLVGGQAEAGRSPGAGGGGGGRRGLMFFVWSSCIKAVGS